jgi:hypothetical protein
LARDDVEGERSEGEPMLEGRCLETGSEGRGPVGGAMEERAGRGRAVPDMLGVGGGRGAEGVAVQSGRAAWGCFSFSLSG